jgi:hypothetical protein
VSNEWGRGFAVGLEGVEAYVSFCSGASAMYRSIWGGKINILGVTP